MPKLRLVLSLVSAICLLVVTPLMAADFSEHLNQTLSARDTRDVVSVLVFMNDQLDVAQVQQVKKLNSYSRQAAHKLLLDDLRDFAQSRQTDFRGALDAAKASGEVESYDAYWIANAFRVTATAGFVESLRSRTDVGAVIEDLPPASLYNPNQVAASPDADSTHGVSRGLRTVGADSMWQLGYTGAGRLVASFDSGVDGTHPALSGSWRGNDHSHAESWFDPIFGEETPHWEASIGPNEHGTSTMGIMVGKNDATGDTTGVAFGAQWISAMVVDVPGANYLSAFQWVADPDGDPNTIEDVPDVLNNSWGFLADNINCSDIFWTPIDNLEALGTVVVFACGNEGPTAASIRNPANRASSPLNTFSVGGTDTLGLFVTGGSSRGPSDCDGVSIKPEVVAPGIDVRTTIPVPKGSYGYRSGTSFASPHVAGAVALLREYNPNATVDQIKLALMNSATDIDVSGEDNAAGLGLINIPAALELLPPNDQVNIFVHSLEHNPIEAGMEIQITATLRNSGTGAVNVTGQLQNSENGITILDGSASFGNMPLGGSASNAGDPYVLQFANQIVNGTQLSVDLRITAAAGYEKFIKLTFTIGEALIRSTYNHVSDSVRFTVTNFGSYGLAPGSALSRTGLGFKYPVGAASNLYQCGLLIGNSDLGVSDGITNTINSVDADFRVAPGGNLTPLSGGPLGDNETFSRFDDGDAYKPMGITVEQRTASFTSAADANYVIMEYTITNDQDTAITNLYVGLYCDWDFPANQTGSDRTGFDRAGGLGYMWENNKPIYRGTAVLNHEGLTTYWAIANASMIYDGITEAEKFDLLTHGTDDSTNFASDQSYSIATGPFSLLPGESDTAAFAMIGASSAANLSLYAQKARSTYRQATPIDDEVDNALPRAYQLEQNFPNPFNPITEIKFNLKRTENVRLEVFNSIGQKVATLIDEPRSSGQHTVFWNGVDDSGQAVATGVYFYRLSAGDLNQTRKMVLLK